MHSWLTLGPGKMRVPHQRLETNETHILSKLEDFGPGTREAQRMQEG